MKPSKGYYEIMSMTPEAQAAHFRECDRRNAARSLEAIYANMKAIHTVNIHTVFGADFAAIRKVINEDWTLPPDMPPAA